jgi:hypothetical protein
MSRWDGARPTVRRGGFLWDSDYVLGTLIALLEGKATVLAAGDLNEARGWDTTHDGYWGQDWFDRACRAGLYDLTYTRWGHEKPTCGSYQLDHFLASKDVVPYLDDASIGPSSGADHQVLMVTLNG